MRRRRLWLGVALGLLCGVGLFTFRYAEGLSYFSQDPRACVNCHIMQPLYDGWAKSSHHAAAGCVDCHLPHGLIGKYLAKADNGYRHSKGFTFQDFHEPIVMTESNRRILQNNCLRCHDDMVHGLRASMETAQEPLRCVHCHANVGHGEKAGMGRFEAQDLPGGGS